MKLLVLMLVVSTGNCFALSKVFIVKGNAINYHSPAFKNAVIELKLFTEQEELDLETEVVFNGHWRDSCQRIQQDQDFGRFDKVIMIAHSWGVSAAFSIANCIEQVTGRTTDLIVSVDPIFKPFSQSASHVPDSVSKVISYYQSRDFFLRGINYMQADSDLTSVIQTHVPILKRCNAHDEVFKVLVDSNTLQNHILDEIAK